MRPLLETLGKTIVLQGGPGAGQHTKMVNQIPIATGMIGVCEALLYGYRAGLDLDRVLDDRRAAPLARGRSRTTGPGCCGGNFEPGFTVDHFVKDMGIALAEAGGMELALPGPALAEELYVALRAQGRAEGHARPHRPARPSLGGAVGRGRAPSSTGSRAARVWHPFRSIRSASPPASPPSRVSPASLSPAAPLRPPARGRRPRSCMSLREWSRLLNAGEDAKVARLFRLPAIVEQGGYGYRLKTVAQVTIWHNGLPARAGSARSP